MTKSIKIAIGLATYKRPKMLALALRSLSQMETPFGTKMELIVASNEKSNLADIEVLLSAFPFETTLVSEEVRGIVFTRNRILSVARDKNIDYLAFIDDDETADLNWIVKLYEAMIKFKADGVEGLVRYNLTENTPSWISEKPFYGKRQKKTGSKLNSASTNNVMVSMSFVAKNCLKFDERLNETGSSDTLFFRNLISKGGKLVWCNEAISYETVPETRATKEWILGRSYKTGYTIVLINTIRFGKVISNVILPFHILTLVFSFLFSLIIHPPFNRSNRVFASRELMVAKGSLDAFYGKKMHYYNVIHGN